MGFFKKSSVSSSVSSDSVSDSSSSSENSDSSSSNSNSGKSSVGSMGSIIASIEKLSAESIANKEVRAATNDRFAKISESLGELRTMLRNNEKTISVMEAKVERTVGIVDAVQPQMLLSSVNKVDFKIEALKAKVEANELIYSKVRDDIRDLRNKFAVFRNLEMVKEINDDSKSRFKDLKKTEFEIIKRSDRIESMFNEIEKSIKDSKENSKSINDLSESIKKLLISADKFKTDMSLKVSRDELVKLQDSLDKSKNDIMGVVTKDFENYKKKALREIEIGVKQEEIRLVHELVKEDLKKSGISIDNPPVNDSMVKMMMYLNMELLSRNYALDASKLQSFKDNPFAFTVVAYLAMKLRDKDAATLKRELVAIGFEDKKIDLLLTHARGLEKSFRLSGPN